MRDFIVDFSLEDPLVSGTDAGYIGENNATTLIVKPGEEILNTGCASFAVVFLTQNKVYRSNHFLPANEFKLKLAAHLTQDHFLSLQLEGYSEKNNVLYKSPMVTNIRFMPSIQGDETEFDPKDYQLLTDIALNTQARHKHINASTLNRLGVSGGQLTYNNSLVCKTPEVKSVVLNYKASDVDISAAISGLSRIDFFSYEDLENFVIPTNAEILSVELQISGDDCPEWLDLRDMINYDPEHPYILYINRPLFDPELYATVFARVIFVNGINKFASYLTSFRLLNVRVNYIEKEES